MPVPIPNLNQLQISQPQPATMKMQGMQMQNELSRIGIAKDRNAIAREGQALEREGFEFNKMKQRLMLGKEHLPTLQKDEYGKYRKWVESIGAPVQFLPSEEEVAQMSDKDFSDLKLRMILGSDNIAKMALEDYKQTIAQSNAQIKREEDMSDFKTKEDYKAKIAEGKDDKTPMARWLRTHPNATDAEIISFANSLKGKGLRVTTNPDGTTTIEMGGGDDMTLKTQGAIEEKLLGGQEQFNRMKAISNEFKPEFQEIGFRFQKAWTGIQARLGQDVPEKDKSSLTEFKKYQRKAIDNINLSIKEMTGAQMSEKEADRLRLAQPDPGEKWYQGDDPITFKAKQDDVLKGARAAIARYTYYKNKDLQDQEIRQLINTNQAVSLESIISGMGD